MSFTALPNVIIDKYLPSLSGAELTVLVVITRKTIGWHKRYDAISLSQFEVSTGLTRPSIVSALRSLESRQLIVKRRQGKTCAYGLNDYLLQSTEEAEELCRTDIGKKILPTASSCPSESTSKKILPTKEISTTTASEAQSEVSKAVANTREAEMHIPLRSQERNSSTSKIILPMEIQAYWLQAQEFAPLKARRSLDKATAKKWADDAEYYGIDLKAIIDRTVRVATINTLRFAQKLIDEEVAKRGAESVITEPKIDAVLELLNNGGFKSE